MRAGRAAILAHEAARDAAITASDPEAFPPPLALEPCPPDLRELRCGARTRKGTPCKRRDLADSGRCKFHGGASTGPRTPEGIARARANLALRWAAKAPNPLG